MPKLSILDRYLWNDSTLPWLEDDLVIAVAETLLKLEKLKLFTFAHDMNAGKRSKRAGGRAKAMGMRKGEPDMRFYLSDGRLKFIEYKSRKGKLTDSQKERFPILQALGFDIRIVKALCPQDAIDQTLKILDEWAL